ncbi:MAG: hypothetical protein Q7T12_06265 [Flavobacterium sp.]|nr:hypothetical protein [Flavobacterium sp.]
MNLIFAKLFEEYIKKNDPAELKITSYISIFYFMLIFVLLLPIKTFIDKIIFQNQVSYDKNTIKFYVFSLLVLIISIVYYVYIKKKYIYKLMEKYKKRKLNKNILYILIIIIPGILLLLAGTITIYFSGGEILGQKTNGLLE